MKLYRGYLTAGGLNKTGDISLEIKYRPKYFTFSAKT